MLMPHTYSHARSRRTRHRRCTGTLQPLKCAKGLLFYTTGQLPPLQKKRTKDSKSRFRSINSRPNNSRPFRRSFEKCRLAICGVSQPFVSRTSSFVLAGAAVCISVRMCECASLRGGGGSGWGILRRCCRLVVALCPGIIVASPSGTRECNRF